MPIDVDAHCWPTEYFDLLDRFGRAGTDAHCGIECTTRMASDVNAFLS